MASEAQRRASAKYDAVMTTQIHLKLNLVSDRDILDRLEQAAKDDPKKGKQGYIKALIKADIQNNPAR